MKVKAFTLIEQLIVIIIIGIITSVVMTVMNPSDIKTDALLKAGKMVYMQIDFATRQMLAKDTNNYTLGRLRDSSGEFSIASIDSLDRLLEVYKKNLVNIKRKVLDTKYASAKLTDGTTTYDTLNVGNYKGFSFRKSIYVGIKLNGNCTTEVNYIYDPSYSTKKTIQNTCGTIFYDVNGEKAPNLLGIDQYILALNKRGIK